MDIRARAASRAAVCRVAEAVGFEGAQDAAVELMADAAARYTRALGAAAAAWAEDAGRERVAFADVEAALRSKAGVSREDALVFLDTAPHLRVSCFGVFREWFVC